MIETWYQIPAPNSLVVDLMALLQKLAKCEVKTFGGLADEILSMLISTAKGRLHGLIL